MPEPRLRDAVGVPVQVHRAAVEVREHRRRDARVVPDEVALGERAVRLLRGEQHLVEVGERHRVLAELPLAALPERVERGELVGSRCRPDRAARPSRGRRRLHLVVRAPRLHRSRVLLGVPALHRRVVVLVQQQPLVVTAAAPAAAAEQDEAALQLLAVEARSGGRRPRSPSSPSRPPRATTCPSPTRSRRRRRTRRAG